MKYRAKKQADEGLPAWHFTKKYEIAEVIDGDQVLFRAARPTFVPFNSLKYLDASQVGNEVLEIGIFNVFNHSYIGVVEVKDNVVRDIQLRKIAQEDAPLIAHDENELKDYLGGGQKFKKIIEKIEAQFLSPKQGKAAGWGSLSDFLSRISDDDDDICCVMVCIQIFGFPPICIMDCFEC